jgi:hypothetical protein
MIDTRFGIQNYLSMPFDTYGGVIGDTKLQPVLFKEFMRLPGIGVRYYVDFAPQGSVLGNQNSTISTEIKSLYGDINTIWSELPKDTRTSIRSAWKHNVVVGTPLLGIDLDKVPTTFVSAIFKHMVPAGLCIPYEARNPPDGVAAASLFFLFGDSMMYWANTTKPGGRRTSANYLILWEAMQYAKQRGCTKFNFGASPRGASGLVNFKRAWGTTEYMYLKYQHIPRILSPILKLREALHG